MSVQSLVDDATFEFTMGNPSGALEMLDQAVREDPASFAAWHAMAEIRFDRGDYDQALEAGTIAVGLKEDDVHIHTTLSRVWMELGNKEEAEKHGARARILGWREQLRESPESGASGNGVD
ncbi:MAG: tetratricopeptide repeat protein [Opitutales bacterium]|jgi:tetratricopeptide (TPR) repeat protein